VTVWEENVISVTIL